MLLLLYIFLLYPPPPISTLFPYTTLFRSPRLAFIQSLANSRKFSANSRQFSRKVPPFHHLAALVGGAPCRSGPYLDQDRKSTRLNQSHSDLVCRLLLEKKKKHDIVVFELR